MGDSKAAIKEQENHDLRSPQWEQYSACSSLRGNWSELQICVVSSKKREKLST
jgi:hypothetical protein